MIKNIRNMVMCFPEGRRKCLTLSYDDGVKQDARMCEMMRKYNVAGTFNLNSCYYVYDDLHLSTTIGDRFTIEECVQLYNSPLFEIATHGFSHPFLNKIPRANVVSEIIDDRNILEEGFGTICRGHAYPYGGYNNDVLDALRLCGVVYARTTRSTKAFALPQDWLLWHPTCHHNEPTLFDLVDKFINGKPRLDPWVFYLWGHTYEFDNDNNWDRIEEFFVKMSGRNDVWYATNIQIYDYVSAYNSLVFSADGRRIYNPSAQDVWFMYNDDGTAYKVGSGQSIDLKKE